MKRGVSLFLMLLGSALSIVAVILWVPHADGGVGAAISGSPIAFGLHAVGALLFSAGAASSGSRSITLFYFSISFALPVVGMATILGLLILLGDGFEEIEEEVPLQIGNPITSKRSAAASVHLSPIARMMREEDSAAIGQILLGLGKGDGAERGHEILRRYQQDSDVELQFYSQSAQRSATEGLELQLKNLRSRLTENAKDDAVRAALAEVLIELASRRSTSGSDANAYIRRALEHLKISPATPKRAALEVRGHLLVKEPAAARSALAGLPDGDLRREQLNIELLYAERDWAKLMGGAEAVEASNIPMRTALAFWGGGQ